MPDGIPTPFVGGFFGRLRASLKKTDPMHFTPEAFRAWPTKRITLLGMSGVGKTHISSMLRGHDWFHFSGDYRIGTRYLDEPILDLIKQQAMSVPFCASCCATTGSTSRTTSRSTTSARC